MQTIQERIAARKALDMSANEYDEYVNGKKYTAADIQREIQEVVSGALRHSRCVIDRDGLATIE